MKIALLGKGLTGGKVLELLVQNNILYTVFDSKNTPTLNLLKGHDVVISFLATTLPKMSNAESNITPDSKR